MFNDKSFLHGILAYVLWGLLPLFWKLLKHIDPFFVLSNRIIWSSAFLILFFVLSLNFKKIGLLFSKKAKPYYLASIIMVFNWGMYIWAVNNNYVVASSLGYFMAPLFYILAGVVFLKERLKNYEMLASGFGLLGVLILCFAADKISVLIALVLAVSIVLYGMLRKKGDLDSATGLYIESILLTPLCLIYIFYRKDIVLAATLYDITFLVLAGPATLIPLLFFASAVKKLPLSVMGYLQYISPVLQFFLGVYVFNESMSFNKILAFVFVWIGIACLLFGKYFVYKVKRIA